MSQEGGRDADGVAGRGVDPWEEQRRRGQKTDRGEPSQPPAEAEDQADEQGLPSSTPSLKDSSAGRTAFWGTRSAERARETQAVQ